MNHEEILRELAAINKKLDPIYEAYNAVSILGTWAKYILYIVATVLGIILAARQVSAAKAAEIIHKILP